MLFTPSLKAQARCCHYAELGYVGVTHQPIENNLLMLLNVSTLAPCAAKYWFTLMPEDPLMAASLAGV